nr:transposase (putative), gypsy type [Tanacetum cinerariifolium]
MLCLLLFLVQSQVVVCGEVTRDCYAPCETTGIWSPWVLPSVGPAPDAYCVVWTRGPDDAIRHHGPQSSVSFVRVRIVATIHLSRFQPFDEECGHVSQSWCFSDIFVVKDPLSVDKAVDLPYVKLLNENRTVIRKYTETFLCLVGLSPLFLETDVRTTLLHSNDEEMGLLDFVNSANPFKVKIGERTLAENDVPLITKTEDRVISPSLQTISLVDHTIQDELNVNVGKRKKRVAFVSRSPPMKKARTEGVVISDSRPSTTGKSPTALRRLIRQSGHADTGSGSVVPAAEDATSSFVTPTLELALEAQAGVNVPMTELVSDARASSVLDLEGGALFVRRIRNITNSARIDNPVTCQNLLDHVTPHGYCVALYNHSDAGFLNNFNINSAQHVCMVSELRLHYEHEIMTREKYENKFIDSVVMVQQRDAKIVDLKARLEKSEVEAATVAELRKCMSDLEVVVAVKAGEVATLNTQIAGFLEKVSALELVRGELDGRDGMAFFRVGCRVGHDFRLVVHKCARSVECRSALGKVISMAIIKVAVPIYYESGSIDREMLLLGVIPAIRESAERRGLSPPPSSTLGRVASSAPPRDSSLGVADYQASTLVLSGDGGSTN